MNKANRTAVVALGGNAISPKEEVDTIYNQFKNTRKSRKAIINLAKQGYNLVVTHGNGPQVGNELLRVEVAADQAPFIPLGVCVADTEGGMGYMIEQSLQNGLMREDVKRDVVTIATQIIVDKDDPSVKNPNKFIGKWYTKEEAEKLSRKYDWTAKKVDERGYRRVVPSPAPKKIINKRIIKQLVDEGTIVIAAGGGGIPVYVMENGEYEGMDAVIDKDLASAVLARDIEANELIILTDVNKVLLNYGCEDEIPIDRISVGKMKKHLEDNQFPPGSMGPKVEAAVNFIEDGGEIVYITSLENAQNGLDPTASTIITR
ncbi:MAG: carbamate kinase [Candidatus Marinimicrobia bacterium]|nr:carbamate kinase [Candidatus Neomarinimicrobiota bacterium]